MSKEEKHTWDKRGKVLFQEKAWCDKTVMKYWSNKNWENMFLDPATPNLVDRFSKQMYIKHSNDYQKDVKTKLFYKTHQLDVLVKFRPQMCLLTNPLKITCGYNSKNTEIKILNFKICSKLTMTRKRVLVTKWVAEAWEIKIKKEMVFRASKKCNITTEEDGS